VLEDLSPRSVALQDLYCNGWQTLTFNKDDWEGTVVFINGFMSSGARSDSLSLYKLESETLSSNHIARWSVRGLTNCTARIKIFRGAFKVLLAK